MLTSQCRIANCRTQLCFQNLFGWEMIVDTGDVPLFGCSLFAHERFLSDGVMPLSPKR
jgi:hypothetical protein